MSCHSVDFQKVIQNLERNKGQITIFTYWQYEMECVCVPYDVWSGTDLFRQLTTLHHAKI